MLRHIFAYVRAVFVCVLARYHLFNNVNWSRNKFNWPADCLIIRLSYFKLDFLTNYKQVFFLFATYPAGNDEHDY